MTNPIDQTHDGRLAGPGSTGVEISSHGYGLGSDGTDASHVKPSALPGTSSAATTVEALGSDIITSWKLLPSLSRGIQQLNHIITVLRHWFPEERPAHPQKRASH